MIYLELPALSPLDQIVRCFWFLKNDAATSAPQPVVADGRLEIVLHAAEPFARIDDRGRAVAQDDALLAGQLTAPIHLLQQGPADVVGIRLRTGAASAVFGTSLADLTNAVVSLGSIKASLRDRLLQAISVSPDPYRRRDALSKALLQAIRDTPDPMAMAAVRALDHPTPIDLARLSRFLGTSTRTLERRVLQATGLAPRYLLRTMRFRRVFRLLQEAAPGSMTRMALAAGYFDQAHCIRDFRRFTGQPPREFFHQDPSLAIALSGESLMATD